jgi:hypothetical protein
MTRFLLSRNMMQKDSKSRVPSFKVRKSRVALARITSCRVGLYAKSTPVLRR